MENYLQVLVSILPTPTLRYWYMYYELDLTSFYVSDTKVSRCTSKITIVIIPVRKLGKQWLSVNRINLCGKNGLLNAWLIAPMNNQDRLVYGFVVLKWRIVYVFEKEIHLRDRVDIRYIPLDNSTETCGNRLSQMKD